MAGLVPAIHVFAQIDSRDVDARHKAGMTKIPDCLLLPYAGLTRASILFERWIAGSLGEDGVSRLLPGNDEAGDQYL